MCQIPPELASALKIMQRAFVNRAVLLMGASYLERGALCLVFTLAECLRRAISFVATCGLCHTSCGKKGNEVHVVMKLQLIYLRIHAGSSLGGYLLRTGKSCRYRISNLTSLFWPRRRVWDSPALFLHFCLNKSRVKFFCRNTCVHTMISLMGR